MMALVAPVPVRPNDSAVAASDPPPTLHAPARTVFIALNRPTGLISAAGLLLAVEGQGKD